MGGCLSARGTNLEEAMASTRLPEGASSGEESIRNPISRGHFDPVRDPASLLTEALGLGDRCPGPLCGPDGSDGDAPTEGLGHSGGGNGDECGQDGRIGIEFHGVTTKGLAKIAYCINFVKG